MPDTEDSLPNESFKADIEHLGPDGKELWTWLQTIGEIAGALPLAIELCKLADRLAEIRLKLKSQGLMLSGNKRNPLLAEEARFAKQYTATWRALGLADADPETKRRVGRPSGNLWRPYGS